MQTIDFSRTTFTFRIDTLKRPPQTASHPPPYTLNNARIPLECRCSVTDKDSGATEQYLLGASCKTERVGVPRDIWTVPNADFTPIFSSRRFMHVKTYASAGVSVESYPPGTGAQSDRQSGVIADAFDDFRVDLISCEAELLDSPAKIVAATLDNCRLNAITSWESAACRFELEYPVKTINANERDGIFQTDTGPVLWPDLASHPDGEATGYDQVLETFELAYAAFNCAEWAELLVRSRATVGADTQVFHFCRSVRLESAVNSILQLPD